jgi:hypothetical protein
MIEAPGLPWESLTKLSSTHVVYLTRTPLNSPTWWVTADLGAGTPAAHDAAEIIPSASNDAIESRLAIRNSRPATGQWSAA